MTNAELMISLGLLLIFCTLIIQIRLSTKTILLLKQQKQIKEKVFSKEEENDFEEIVSEVELNCEVVEPAIPLSKNERLEAQVQDEVMTTVFLKMFQIRNSVHKQMTNIHVKSIENSPKTVGIDEHILSRYYSQDQIDLMDTYWDLFNRYIDTYWTRNNGGFKTVFSGDIDKKTGEVGKMLLATEQLLVNLDKLMEEFQSDLN